MKRYYLIDDPMKSVFAESMGAIYGGDPSIKKDGLKAWVARAITDGVLANKYNKPTDMVTSEDPSNPIDADVFFSMYKEEIWTVN